MKTNLFPTREDLDNGWNFNCDSLESIKASLPEQDGHYDIHFCINVVSEMVNGIKLGWKLFKTDMGFMPQFSKSHYEQKKEKFEKTGSLL